MDENDNDTSSDDTLKKFRVQVCNLPLDGLIVADLAMPMQLFRDQPWSIDQALYHLCPLFVFCVLYLILTITIGKKNISTKGNKIRRWLALALLAILLIETICFYKIKNVEIENVTLYRVQQIIKTDEDSITYVIYGSEHRDDSEDMLEEYKKAFLGKEIRLGYCVDLDYEGQNSSLIQAQGIDKIPTLVIYKNGKEMDRVEGTATVNILSDHLI